MPRGKQRYRSLFCSFVLPRHPGHSGGEIRDFHLLRHLLGLSEVDFFALHHTKARAQDDPLRQQLSALHDPLTVSAAMHAPAGMVARYSYRLGRVFQDLGIPFPYRRYHLDAAAQIMHARIYSLGPFCRALRNRDPDFVFVSPQVNPIALLARDRGARTRWILASSDVEAVRLRRLAEARRGVPGLAVRLEARRARRFERLNLAQFDGVIAVSKLDRQRFQDDYDLAPDRVVVIENGVDPEYFAFSERGIEPAPIVLYVGSLIYEPNRQAAWRLLRSIAPAVRERHPDIRFWIVGQEPGAKLLSQADGLRTVVTGRVPDVRPFLARATVACVPLLAGSGTKYKVLEAISAGVPVVGSPLAFEGLTLHEGEHVLVGRSDQEIVAGISHLVENPEAARQLARRGRAFVEKHYAWQVILPRLDPWLEHLAHRYPRSDRP